MEDQAFYGLKKQNDFNMGKIPPQALDLEELVLGACLIDKNAISEIIDIITPNSFYKASHQIIFEVMLSMYNEKKIIDYIALKCEIEKKGKLEEIGGIFYLANLTNRIATSANIEYHARIIQQKYLSRELIRISTDTLNSAFDDKKDIFDLIDETERNIFSVGSFQSNKNISDINTLSARRIIEIEAINNRKGELTGVPSGFTEIDRITNGWQSPDLIIIAARPSMGKTGIALSFALNACYFNRTVAFFSLEMSAAQLTDRRLSVETEIPLSKLQKGGLNAYDFTKLNSVKDLPLYIDDTPALSILDFRRKARKLKSEKKIELIIVDYIQLMTVGESPIKLGNREQEVSLISRSLKSVAKELNIPIIALSQLSRDVEKRGNKKPILSDLRESGAIEQDADIVTFIHRPEYYDKDNTELKGWALFIIEKHRNGALAEIKLKWQDYLTKFSDFDVFESNITNSNKLEENSIF